MVLSVVMVDCHVVVPRLRVVARRCACCVLACFSPLFWTLWSRPGERRRADESYLCAVQLLLLLLLLPGRVTIH